MSDGDGAQPWGERSEFTLLRWCFSRRCDTGSLQEEEGQRCRWGVRSHLHLQLLSTPLSSCFFIRPGFQAKVRQTGGRTWCNVPKRRDDGLGKIYEIGGRFFFSFLFFCIKLAIWIKCATLTQLCDTWLNWPHCTIIIRLSQRHNSAQYFNPTNSASFFFSCAIPHAIILLSYRLRATIQLCNYPDTLWHANYCQSSPYSGVLNTIYSVVKVQNETYIFTYFNTYAAAMYRWFNEHSTSLFSHIFLLCYVFSFLYFL